MSKKISSYNRRKKNKKGNAPLDKPFIFETKSNKRWGVLICSFTLVVIVSCMVLFMSGLGIYFNPIMPEVETKETNEFSHIAPSGVTDSSATFLHTDTNEKFLQEKITHNQDVYAFHVNWDKNSELSLRRNIDTIDVLIPQWFRLTPDLEVESNIQMEIGELAKKNNVKVVPLINNEQNGEWNQKTIHKLLSSPEEQAKLIKNLHTQIKKYGYDGINIDFENINKSDRDLLTDFMRDLYKVFHAEGLSVSIDVPPANEAFDYKALENHADQIILMSYDENVLNPGSIASSSWFKENLSQISKDKLIVGLGNYGYDWDWESKQAGEAVSFDDVTRLIEKADLKIQWDDMSQTPYLKYRENNKVHEIWFLDSATFYNQLKMSAQAGTQGIALWRLGTEDPSVWDILKEEKTEELLTVKNGDTIYSTGEGNIFRAIENGAEGERSLQFDDAGFITSEAYVKNPKSSEFERLSQPSDKEIVLTFDDGPDPKYTEDILKTLKHYQIPATFFIIGKQAMLHQGIVEQMYRDGHEIGNHTFSHPYINQLSDDQLKLELNSTQRIIQGITGHTSLLYRSPYGDEEAKYLQPSFQRMHEITQMGYVTVNYDIDAKDWKLRDSKAIVENVLNQVSSGDIILLHDGGGDREATVQALPKLIEQLQSKGYTFVTISKLMDESQSSILSPVPDVENPIVQSTKVMLFNITNFKYLISILLYGVLFIALLRLLILACLAFKHKKQAQDEPPRDSFTPFVSVIIAAYNEEKVINRTIQSILKSDYPSLEILVVDDGSKDQTSLVVSKHFSDNEKVHLLHKKNGGKASAINMGSKRSAGDILVAIDADTIVPPEAISLLVRHFADEKVAAVSGNVRVGNVHNLLTAWQHVEYVTGFNLEKRAFDTLNCVTVVPGAIGAWRKQAIKELGYFSADTLAEDTDLTLSILRRGHKVIIDEQAYAYTEAPETVSDFLKQRFRWTFGTLQCFWKHKKAFGRRKHKSLGFIALPNILLFQFGVPLFAPFLDLLFILGIVVGDVKKSLLVFGCYFITDLLISLVAFRMEKLSPKPLMTLILQRMVYRYLLLFVIWKSILTALKGNRVGWNKLERSDNLDLKDAG
ncbi:glycosyltransferase [Bacillus sp. V3B]|uniref:glycosyltransferase n=1 Tax=Bacillus sp. V3B TaxID=2804915 RepID=UPI002109BA6D|nr:glycosyltransferase [Bacillus sp. V3B]MCQ6277195.1 glycosyltransferase [Bacillus sp. V3B]